MSANVDTMQVDLDLDPSTVQWYAHCSHPVSAMEALANSAEDLVNWVVDHAHRTSKVTRRSVRFIWNTHGIRPPVPLPDHMKA